MIIKIQHTAVTWGKYNTNVYTSISFLVSIHSYTFMHNISFSWIIFLAKMCVYFCSCCMVRIICNACYIECCQSSESVWLTAGLHCSSIGRQTYLHPYFTSSCHTFLCYQCLLLFFPTKTALGLVNGVVTLKQLVNTLVFVSGYTQGLLWCMISTSVPYKRQRN